MPGSSTHGLQGGEQEKFVDFIVYAGMKFYKVPPAERRCGNCRYSTDEIGSLMKCLWHHRQYVDRLDRNSATGRIDLYGVLNLLGELDRGAVHIIDTKSIHGCTEWEPDGNE